MKVVFVGVFYYQGLIRHLYFIFKVYKKIAKSLESRGIECYFFSKQNEILPKERTLSEEQFYNMLPEVDLIFMWNGSLGKEIEISQKCKDQGIPVYYMELAWLPQRHHIYFDLKGINYESSLRDWGYKPLKNKDKDWLDIQIAKFRKKCCIPKGVKIPEGDFVFVPLQVENDSQIVRFSPKIKKMQELIDFVGENIKDPVIFKKHPKDDPGDLKIPNNCEYVTEGSVHDYLPKCKYVITINSTVGVEALTYKKPVITLGQAFYEDRGLTYIARDKNQLIAGVKWSESGMINENIIDAFLFYLFKKQVHMNLLDQKEVIDNLLEGLTE